MKSAQTLGRSIFVSGLLFGVLAGSTFAGSVDDDLRALSRSDGLGIARLDDTGRLEVRYFDRIGSAVLLDVPGISALYDIEAVPQLILGALTIAERGAVEPSEFQHPRFALFSLQGAAPRPVGLPNWPRAAAVSPDGKGLAALWVDSGRHRASLQFGDVAWTSVSTAYTLELGDDPENLTVVNYVQENFGWSPDARSIVYSKQGRLYICDVQTKTTRLIADGWDPSWSPNGKFIAYRSGDHALVLYELGGDKSQTLTHGIDVEGFPRWSPDSAMVMFTRVDMGRAALNPFTHDGTDFVALRIRDGSSTVAFAPHNGVDNRRYFWVRTGRRE
jgi:hypothetical protein